MKPNRLLNKPYRYNHQIYTFYPETSLRFKRVIHANIECEDIRLKGERRRSKITSFRNLEGVDLLA
jgi:hypothetical protein